ncbi:MAG: putative niacin/nicotinamide transporter NaiP [Verrucomicrobiota bacterium]
MNDVPATRVAITRGMQMTLLAGFLGWMMDGYEQALFPTLAGPALRSMVPAEVAAQGAKAVGIWVGGWMAIITSAFLVGAAFGGAAFGWLGDRIGRVKAMSFSILFYSVFSGVCYFATDPWHLAGARFLSALGMGGEWALGVALVMEAWPERHRSKMAAAIGMAANLGMVLVGLMALAYPADDASWRIHFLIGASPAILTLLIRLFVPESEKWERSVAREAAAPARSKLGEVFGGELRRPTIVGILMVAVVFVGTWGAVQWIPLWIGELAGVANPRAKALAMVIVSAGACVSTILAPLLLSGLSRRRGYQLLCVLALAATAWIYRTPAAWTDTAFLGLMPWLMAVKIFALGMAATAFFGFFPLYLPELFPTRVRATGQGVCYNTGRLVAVPFVLLSGALVERLGGFQSAAAAITLVYAAGLFVAFFAQETAGQALQD